MNATETISRLSAFSEERLAAVRAGIAEVVPAGQLIVTCGSYGRRDASTGSDMDYYAVLDEPLVSGNEPVWSADLKDKITSIVGKAPSDGGAFATNICRADLLNNYGGTKDSNDTITRRMLFLLGGDHLSCSEKFYSIRREIVQRYVNNTPKDHQIAFYLLNDVVRYWRTLAVDYANKTLGTDGKKPWAIRNIKLVFSRKLLYASGIVSLALTADRREDDKVDILVKLFSMTPVERILYVCGEPRSKRLMELYSVFLEAMDNPSVRDHLEKLPKDDQEKDMIFRRLKNEGHYFSRELMSLLHTTFHSSHPIHMALIF